MVEPKGYYRRGQQHPPHFDRPGAMQHVVFRLAGTLPDHPGPIWLGRADIADVVQQALEHFDGKRYDLYAWCIMTNHVHVMLWIRDDFRLPAIVHSWKSFTATRCNRLLQRSGSFWQDDYFDRCLRDEEDAAHTAEYILGNGGRAWMWRQHP